MAFVANFTSQASSATESRLTTLSTQLQALARDSDPRAETRLAALLAERSSIDQQIAAVESGVFPVLDANALSSVLPRFSRWPRRSPPISPASAPNSRNSTVICEPASSMTTVIAATLWEMCSAGST